ncbi:restriction endonuclease fold toxin-2 domain-containing protein [Streptomyces sp. NPDC001404]|uniref:restriction endonuclease fold toxin-2 domain-containing protein n=1 Tax=Streptomyces sp. NPDC001404 TaxID=3364571 RepID=UPI00367A7F56
MDRLHLVASGMIKASMGMVDVVMPGARDTAIGLGAELSQQSGMAGDDDAGHAFRKVYKPAAATTLDQIGFSAYVFGGTGRALMKTAREFMVVESKIAAAFAGHQVDLTDGMGDPGEECGQAFLGLGQHLPEVVGGTAWYDQYAPGGGSRYRGSPEKVRAVARSWRHAGRLLERFFGDAQTYARTANDAHSGEAAMAFDAYFKRTIGFGDPPGRAQEDEPLVANLVAACNQLAKACDKYADHIERALIEISNHKADFFRIDNPLDSPMLGGNGDDGGLHLAVAGDPYIHQLGDVAHAVDASQARVTLPGAGGGWHAPMLPLAPLAPLPLVLASYALPMASPHNSAIPSRDPIPPDPRTNPQLLSSSEEAQFRLWTNSLNAGGFAGGGDQNSPENAYQLRVSGYPERELPLPPEFTGRSGKGLMADGLRPADGYAVEAKYVHKPDCEKPTTFRNLDKVDKTLGTPPKLDARGKPKFDPFRDAMYVGDEKELVRYKAAMENPDNQLRGMEIVTNDKAATAYWQSMMLMTGVKGTARYVP